MTGLYIHIPFCKQKCFYCDFVSGPHDSFSKEQYMEALIKEMAFYSRERESQRVFDTVFIGGGTPSLLEVEELSRLFTALKNSFTFGAKPEITMEANPESLSKEKIEAAINLGVNRFSLGVQTFDDRLLKNIGRIHSSDQVFSCFNLLRKAGCKNINLDLIYGLPGQDLASWSDTLHKAVKLQPEHLSLYNLIVSPHTHFGDLEDKGQLLLPMEDIQLKMLSQGAELLKHVGYEHYEIANFAKDGFTCRHNLIYWHNLEYLGLGLGAYSYLNSCRRGNSKVLKAYNESWLKKDEPLIEEEESLSLEEEKTETIIMALRLKEGIKYDRMTQRFCLDFRKTYSEIIEWAVESGFGEEPDQNTFSLTEKGWAVSNQIMIKFLP